MERKRTFKDVKKGDIFLSVNYPEVKWLVLGVETSETGMIRIKWLKSTEIESEVQQDPLWFNPNEFLPKGFVIL